MALDLVDIHPKIGMLSSGTRFKADLADPRFGALFKSQDFAIDPTDPRFKQIDGAPAIAAAVAQKRSTSRRNTDVHEASAIGQQAVQIESTGKCKSICQSFACY